MWSLTKFQESSTVGTLLKANRPDPENSSNSSKFDWIVLCRYSVAGKSKLHSSLFLSRKRKGVSPSHDLFQQRDDVLCASLPM